MKDVQRIPGIYYTTLRDSHFSAFNVSGSFSNPLIYDMIPFVLRDMNGTQALQKLGFQFDTSKAIVYQVRAILLRLLMNPVPPLCHRIRSYTIELRKKTYIGYQIRMGGSIATTKERATFLQPEDVHQFANVTREYAEKNHISMSNLTVYISTDSDTMIPIIIKDLGKEVQVRYMTGFGRGHSSPNHLVHGKKNPKEVLYSSFIDLFVLKDCNLLVWTHGSSFGETAFSFGLPSIYSFSPLPSMAQCTVFDYNLYNRRQIAIHNSAKPFSVC